MTNFIKINQINHITNVNTAYKYFAIFLSLWHYLKLFIDNTLEDPCCEIKCVGGKKCFTIKRYNYPLFMNFETILKAGTMNQTNCISENIFPNWYCINHSR